MNLNEIKKQIGFIAITVVTVLFAIPSSSADTGGPDEFGYTFKDSNEENGPDYDWIDIT